MGSGGGGGGGGSGGGGGGGGSGGGGGGGGGGGAEPAVAEPADWPGLEPAVTYLADDGLLRVYSVAEGEELAEEFTLPQGVYSTDTVPAAQRIALDRTEAGRRAGRPAGGRRGRRRRDAGAGRHPAAAIHHPLVTAAAEAGLIQL